eukprot:6208235-Prymnesium_polylepis.1
MGGGAHERIRRGLTTPGFSVGSVSCVEYGVKAYGAQRARFMFIAMWAQRAGARHRALSIGRRAEQHERSVGRRTAGSTSGCTALGTVNRAHRRTRCHGQSRTQVPHANQGSSRYHADHMPNTHLHLLAAVPVAGHLLYYHVMTYSLQVAGTQRTKFKS